MKIIVIQKRNSPKTVKINSAKTWLRHEQVFNALCLFTLHDWILLLSWKWVIFALQQQYNNFSRHFFFPFFRNNADRKYIWDIVLWPCKCIDVKQKLKNRSSKKQTTYPMKWSQSLFAVNISFGLGPFSLFILVLPLSSCFWAMNPFRRQFVRQILRAAASLNSLLSTVLIAFTFY